MLRILEQQTSGSTSKHTYDKTTIYNLFRAAAGVRERGESVGRGRDGAPRRADHAVPRPIFRARRVGPDLALSKSQ